MTKISRRIVPCLGWLSLLMLGSATPDVPASEEHPEAELLKPGLFHGDEVTAHSGETWWALLRAQPGFTLTPVTLRVDPVHDPVADDPDEKTGKEVYFEQAGEPHETVLLFKGIPDLRERPVTTAFDGQMLVRPGQEILLGVSTGPWQSTGWLGAEGEGVEGGAKDYKLYVRDWDSKRGSRTQYLFTAPRSPWPLGGVEEGPNVLWVGDLDGDFRWDFLINTTDHYNVSEWTLFLSTAAGKGEIVGKAAVFRTMGC